MSGAELEKGRFGGDGAGGGDGGEESCGRRGWWRMRRGRGVEVEDKGRRVKDKRRRRKRWRAAAEVVALGILWWRCVLVCVKFHIFFHTQCVCE